MAKTRAPSPDDAVSEASTVPQDNETDDEPQTTPKRPKTKKDDEPVEDEESGGDKKDKNKKKGGGKKELVKKKVIKKKGGDKDKKKGNDDDEPEEEGEDGDDEKGDTSEATFKKVRKENPHCPNCGTKLNKQAYKIALRIHGPKSWCKTMDWNDLTPTISNKQKSNQEKFKENRKEKMDKKRKRK
ncbi:hypothetical protein K440DRAFT_656941 [Wilcoxina mikolae CBS 423.85]|nr:hypothetical protein K440DRAFT_656941 [Wilcoxina mikolae CBS 423.85]